MTTARNRSRKPPTPEETGPAILEVLRSSKRGPLKAKEIANQLGVPTARYRAFKAQLTALEREGKIYRVKGRRYALPGKINLIVGTVSVTRAGDAFVAPEDGGGSVFVGSSMLGSAMDGDRVVVRVERRPRRRSPEGRVIKVLERAHSTLVGTFHRGRRWSYVTPLDRRVAREVLIPTGDENDAEDGQVVVVRVTSYGEGSLSPAGVVDVVLGSMDAPGVDVLSIIHGYGLQPEFPPEVEEEARRVVAAHGMPDPQGRTDLRDLLVFTIDPSDAKDHDDALSISEVGNGLWEVGIHIADVSLYVEEGGLIDLEALRRGTSVYLVDRVVPMLPHLLSSDICSLVPEVDRAALSTLVTLDSEGRVQSHRFERTVVRSRHRLSYEEAEEVLSGSGALSPELDEALRALDGLARTLRDRREKRGSLDFQIPEAKVLLNSKGEPTEIRRVPRLESHRLIEDFMLLANELVARVAQEKKLPILFRVHEPPPADRQEELREVLRPLGHHLPKRDLKGKDVQRVLKSSVGTPSESMISTAVLRAMSRARYAARNVGHFGLAAPTYTHFTSPIRRYPDLVNHRILIETLLEKGSMSEDWRAGLDSLTSHTSERERAADQAERDSVGMKKVEYMERHLGDVFHGVISGVTSFGFFVQLEEVFVEGLVHVNTLDDDYYLFISDRLSLVGERTGRAFGIGEPVTVQVARVDKELRQIDFALLRSA